MSLEAGDPDPQELGPRAARGGALVVACQAAKLVIQLAALAGLARLLAPADFGLLAVASALAGFALLFSQTGLSLAALQRARLDPRELSALFWVNAGMGLALAGGLVVGAPRAAELFGDPRLTGVVRGLALGLALGGLSVQHLALLRRRLHFGRIAAIELVALGSASAAALAAAAAGAGVGALVVQQVGSIALTSLGAWWACPWRPGPPLWNPAVRSMLRFGAHHTGFGLWNHLARHFDDLLIGGCFGAATLGFYGRAYALLMLPLGQLVAPLSQVAVPTLARLRDDPPRFRRAYLRALRSVAYLSLPACALLFVLADEIVAIALGPGWERSALLFRWLALAGFWQPVASTAGWLHLAAGRADRMFRWSLVGGSVTMLAFALGLPWGPEGMAACYSLAVWGLLLPQLRYALAGSGVTLGEVLQTLLRPTACAAVVAAAALAAHHGAADLPPLASLAGVGLASALGAALLLALWPAGRRDAAELFAAARGLRRA